MSDKCPKCNTVVYAHSASGEGVCEIPPHKPDGLMCRGYQSAALREQLRDAREIIGKLRQASQRLIKTTANPVAHICETCWEDYLLDEDGCGKGCKCGCHERLNEARGWLRRATECAADWLARPNAQDAPQ